MEEVEVKEKKKEKKAPKALPATPWVYYKLSIKFTREVLGAQARDSISVAHLREKSKKELAKYAKQVERMRKLDIGNHTISPQKEVEEMQGIVRNIQSIIGKKDPLPDNIPDLVTLAKEYEEIYAEASENSKVTIFNIGPDGRPRISSHVILGNLKEILRGYKESNQHHFINSNKVGCDRIMAMDIKPVEEWLYPDQDIVRKEDSQEANLLERPIRFPDGFGGEQTAIAQSERLPAGTKVECTLRCRNGSTVAEMENLLRLLENGKNVGIGPWRGSGNKGAYLFKLEKLEDYFEPVDEEGYR